MGRNQTKIRQNGAKSDKNQTNWGEIRQKSDKLGVICLKILDILVLFGGPEEIKIAFVYFVL